MNLKKYKKLLKSTPLKLPYTIALGIWLGMVFPTTIPAGIILGMLKYKKLLKKGCDSNMSLLFGMKLYRNYFFVLLCLVLCQFSLADDLDIELGAEDPFEFFKVSLDTPRDVIAKKIKDLKVLYHPDRAPKDQTAIELYSFVFKKVSNFGPLVLDPNKYEKWKEDLETKKRRLDRIKEKLGVKPAATNSQIKLMVKLPEHSKFVRADLDYDPKTQEGTLRIPLDTLGFNPSYILPAFLQPGAAIELKVKTDQLFDLEKKLKQKELSFTETDGKIINLKISTSPVVYFDLENKNSELKVYFPDLKRAEKASDISPAFSYTGVGFRDQRFVFNIDNSKKPIFVVSAENDHVIVISPNDIHGRNLTSVPSYRIPKAMVSKVDDTHYALYLAEDSSTSELMKPFFNKEIPINKTGSQSSDEVSNIVSEYYQSLPKAVRLNPWGQVCDSALSLLGKLGIGQK